MVIHQKPQYMQSAAIRSTRKGPIQYVNTYHKNNISKMEKLSLSSPNIFNTLLLLQASWKVFSGLFVFREENAFTTKACRKCFLRVCWVPEHKCSVTWMSKHIYRWQMRFIYCNNFYLNVLVIGSCQIVTAQSIWGLLNSRMAQIRLPSHHVR